jgi:hypothetical protein
VIAIVSICLLASPAVSGSRTPSLKGGGPDGAGGIPFTGGPSVPNSFIVPVQLTLGRVVDLQGVGVARLSVVVTSDKGAVVAAGMTDLDGFFVLSLPIGMGLELAIIGTGVADLPVKAGVPVLIVLP